MFKRSSNFYQSFDFSFDAELFNGTSVVWRLYNIKGEYDTNQYSNWTFASYNDTDEWDMQDGISNLMVYAASLTIGEEHPRFVKIKASSEHSTQVGKNVTSSVFNIPLESYDIVAPKLRFDQALDLGPTG